MRKKDSLSCLCASQNLPLCCDFSIGGLLACNAWFLSNVIATAVTAICKSEIYISNLISHANSKKIFGKKKKKKNRKNQHNNKTQPLILPEENSEGEKKN